MDSTTNVKKAPRITPAVVSLVQSIVAKTNGGTIPKGSQVGDLQREAARTYGKSVGAKMR